MKCFRNFKGINSEVSISPTICEQLHWLHMEMLHLCGLIWCVHLTPNSVLTILTSKCCTFVNWFDVCLKVIFPRSFILTIRALKCYTFVNWVNVFLKIVCIWCVLTIWQGMALKAKGLKLKLLPRAYTKVGCHPPPPTKSLILLN